MTRSTRRLRGLARWLPALGVMVLIFSLSSVSGLRVSDDAEVDRPLRALAHVGVYALLAGLLLFALSGLDRPRAWAVAGAFVGAVLYGISDELHQALVPGRAGRLDDVLIDAAGAAMGVIAAAALLGSRARMRDARDRGPERDAA